MKRTYLVSKMLATFVVMSIVTLAPAAVPISTPRATVRTLIGCLGLTTGTVVVTDSHGHTYSQACSANLKTVLSYSELYPTEDAPWQAIITVQPLPYQLGLPQTCQFRLTGAPIHVYCVAAGFEPLIVDLDLILTTDYGGWWV